MQRPPVDKPRITHAHAHDRCCALCEHRCGVDRSAGERGPCKAGNVARVFRHRVEYGEELDLVPSHLFYLSGCDLRCGFCIAGINAFDPSRGRELTSEFFNDAIDWGKQQGARNIQWVGGEPTIHLPALLDVMANCPTLPPVVWKSDFHGTPEAFELLRGVADVYIADFKFGNDHCARRLAGVDRYCEIVQRNLRIAATQGRLIVRHLLLPGHLDCCFKPVIRWLNEHLPDAEFSLRDGYLPKWRAARFEEINRLLTADEVHLAHELTHRVGLRVIQ